LQTDHSADLVFFIWMRKASSPGPVSTAVKAIEQDAIHGATGNPEEQGNTYRQAALDPSPGSA
jgi:hypothetical protein